MLDATHRGHAFRKVADVRAELAARADALVPHIATRSAEREQQEQDMVLFYARVKDTLAWLDSCATLLPVAALAPCHALLTSFSSFLTASVHAERAHALAAAHAYHGIERALATPTAAALAGLAAAAPRWAARVLPPLALGPDHWAAARALFAGAFADAAAAVVPRAATGAATVPVAALGAAPGAVRELGVVRLNGSRFAFFLHCECRCGRGAGASAGSGAGVGLGGLGAASAAALAVCACPLFALAHCSSERGDVRAPAAQREAVTRALQRLTPAPPAPFETFSSQTGDASAHAGAAVTQASLLCGPHQSSNNSSSGGGSVLGRVWASEARAAAAAAATAATAASTETADNHQQQQLQPQQVRESALDSQPPLRATGSYKLQVTVMRRLPGETAAAALRRTQALGATPWELIDLANANPTASVGAGACAHSCGGGGDGALSSLNAAVSGETVSGRATLADGDSGRLKLPSTEELVARGLLSALSGPAAVSACTGADSNCHGDSEGNSEASITVRFSVACCDVFQQAQEADAHALWLQEHASKLERENQRLRAALNTAAAGQQPQQQPQQELQHMRPQQPQQQQQHYTQQQQQQHGVSQDTAPRTAAARARLAPPTTTTAATTASAPVTAAAYAPALASPNKAVTLATPLTVPPAVQRTRSGTDLPSAAAAPVAGRNSLAYTTPLPLGPAAYAPANVAPANNSVHSSAGGAVPARIGADGAANAGVASEALIAELTQLTEELLSVSPTPIFVPNTAPQNKLLNVAKAAASAVPAMSVATPRRAAASSTTMAAPPGNAARAHTAHASVTIAHAGTNASGVDAEADAENETERLVARALAALARHTGSVPALPPLNQPLHHTPSRGNGNANAQLQPQPQSQSLSAHLPGRRGGALLSPTGRLLTGVPTRAASGDEDFDDDDDNYGDVGRPAAAQNNNGMRYSGDSVAGIADAYNSKMIAPITSRVLKFGVNDSATNCDDTAQFQSHAHLPHDSVRARLAADSSGLPRYAFRSNNSDSEILDVNDNDGRCNLNGQEDNCSIGNYADDASSLGEVRSRQDSVDNIDN